MKERIFRNFSLKVVSVVCAVILWAIIVNVNDPNTGYTFSGINVQLINTESLTDNGYTYEVIEGGKISVYVSGPKSIVTDLKTSDIVATADLSKITSFTSYTDIDVKIIKNGNVLTDIEATPKTSAIKLKIDNRVSESFNVNVNTVGDLAPGYEIVSHVAVPNEIKVIGASQMVSLIQRAEAVVNVEGLDSDTTLSVPVSLLDDEGKEIPRDKLELSREEIDYSIKVHKVKTVPIKYSVSGKVAEGYEISEIKSNKDQMEISGPAEIIDAINEINIPSDRLNIEGKNSDKVFIVNVAEYLPQDIVVKSGNNVQIKVSIVGKYFKSFTISNSAVKFINLANGYSAQMNDDLTVKIYGKKSVVDLVTVDKLKPIIDLSGLAEGTHLVVMGLTMPNGCDLDEKYQAQVVVKKQEELSTVN